MPYRNSTAAYGAKFTKPNSRKKQRKPNRGHKRVYVASRRHRVKARTIQTTSPIIDKPAQNTRALLFTGGSSAAASLLTLATQPSSRQIESSSSSSPSLFECLQIFSDSPLLANKSSWPQDNDQIRELLPQLAATSNHLDVSPIPPGICKYYATLRSAKSNSTLVSTTPSGYPVRHTVMPLMAPYIMTTSTEPPLTTPEDEIPIELEINVWITIIIPALCLILGTFGNVMAFLVVSRLGNTLKSSSAAYLKYLAVFDLIGIWSSLPRYLTRALYTFDLRYYHPYVCKFQRFAVYFSLDVAAWITVAVTADRLIAVRFPYHASKFCTERISRFVLLITCISFLFLDGHVFYTYGYKEFTHGNTTVSWNCAHPDEISEFIWKYVQPILATLTYAVGPFAFLLVANIIIAQRLIKQSKFLKKCSTATQHRQAESDRTVYTMSFMLVATSVVFLVMNTPSFFYMVLKELYFSKREMSTKEKAGHRLVKTCFNMAMYINHSVNFFIYCLSAKRFRIVFWQVLTCHPGDTHLGDMLIKTRRDIGQVPVPADSTVLTKFNREIVAAAEAVSANDLKTIVTSTAGTDSLDQRTSPANGDTHYQSKEVPRGLSTNLADVAENKQTDFELILSNRHPSDFEGAATKTNSDLLTKLLSDEQENVDNASIGSRVGSLRRQHIKSASTLPTERRRSSEKVYVVLHRGKMSLATIVGVVPPSPSQDSLPSNSTTVGFAVSKRYDAESRDFMSLATSTSIPSLQPQEMPRVESSTAASITGLESPVSNIQENSCSVISVRNATSKFPTAMAPNSPLSTSRLVSDDDELSNASTVVLRTKPNPTATPEAIFSTTNPLLVTSPTEPFSSTASSHTESVMSSTGSTDGDLAVILNDSHLEIDGKEPHSDSPTISTSSDCRFIVMCNGETFL